jgi:hypothetical protein
MRNKLWIAALRAIAPAAFAQSVAGLWDATLTLNQVQIPFRIELAGDGLNIKGWFFNGDEKVISTAGKLENGSLVLNFEQYATKLEATWKDGRSTVSPVEEVAAFRAPELYPLRGRRASPLMAVGDRRKKSKANWLGG